MFRLDLNMELPQGQTGSVGTSVASAEQVHMCYNLFTSTVYISQIGWKGHRKWDYNNNISTDRNVTFVQISTYNTVYLSKKETKMQCLQKV